MNNKQDQMHPDDLRNLFLFFLLSIVLYFGYNHFVLKPKTEAMEAAARAQAEALENAPPELLAGPVERGQALGGVTRIPIENENVSGSLSLKGGRLDDIAFKHYYETLEKKNNIVLLSPKKTAFPRYVEYGWVAKDKTIRVPDADTLWQVYGSGDLTKDNPVTLFWENGQGLRFERKVTLDDQYMFNVTQRVANNSGKAITLYPFSLISQKGLPPDFEGRFVQYEGPIAFVGNELIERKYKKLKKSAQHTAQGDKGWIGVTDKYWLTAIIPAQGRDTKYRFHYLPNPLPSDDKKENGRFQVDYLAAAVEIPNGKTGQVSSHVFAGPKQLHKLNEYQKELGIPRFDLAVDFGWFWFMTKPFFLALHFFGELFGNFGVAILALTFLLRMSVYPLTNTSYRSFAKMKKVAPETAVLREKHGDDRMALQQALMEMYQREGVNPMAGCFPILVQIPIFFAFYKVLFGTIEIRHAPFFGWIEDLSAADPTSVFNLFGALPYDVPSFLQIGVWPCVMLVAMIFQKKLNPPPQDPLQRDLMNYFPFIITFIMAQFAAGLVIYWAFSAILSIMQQAYIMRSLGVPIHLFGETEEEKEPEAQPLTETAVGDIEGVLLEKSDDGDPDKPIKPPKPKKKKKKK